MLGVQTLSLANHCNLACTYCWYETDGLKYPATQLGAHDYEKWLEACRQEVTLDEAYITGGEPTLHPEFSEILDVVASQFVYTTVLTNGITVGIQDNLRTVIARSGAQVHVSLDHVTASLGDRVRGGTKATLRGIKALAENAIPTQVTMVLTSQNAVDLETVITFCRTLGLALEVNLVSVPDRHPLSVMTLRPDERERVARVLRGAADLLGRPAYYAEVRSILRHGRLTPLSTCHAASRGVFVESNGTIFICGQRRAEHLGSILCDSPVAVMLRQDEVLSRTPGGPCVSLDCLTNA